VSLKEKVTEGNVRYAAVESEHLGTYCEDGRRGRDWSVEERGELVYLVSFPDPPRKEEGSGK